MDRQSEAQGEDWVNAAIFGGNWNNAAYSGSRASNWNNAASNSDNNIGARLACDDKLFRSGIATACRAGPSSCGQPYPSRLGEHIKRSGHAPGSHRERCNRQQIMKRHGNLIEAIADIGNIRAAYRKAASGKRFTYGYLEFKEYAEANLGRLRDQILDGSWEQGGYREFTVYEPKPRLISALYFPDRVAQHALINVIGPIFERTFLPYAFACRKGLGTHAGVRHVQASLRRTGARYFLKTDYSKFFPSVNRATLHALIRRKVKCHATLRLIEAMVPASGHGLPIGSLTSQIFANVYGTVIDRFIHDDLGAIAWARYMDDIVILGHDLGLLREWFSQIENVSQERLDLSISKWQASPVSRGINFLGYRIWSDHKLLRKDSVVRAKRRIRHLVDTGDDEALGRFLASWKGHASHADSHNLIKNLEDIHATCD